MTHEERGQEFRSSELAENLFLRLGLDAAGAGVWRWDAATNIIEWDAACATLFGVTAKCGPVTEFLKFVHPDDRASLRKAWDEACRISTPAEVRFRIRRPDGSLRYVGARGCVLGQSTTHAPLMMGLLWDETQSQRLSREHEALLSLGKVLHDAPDESELVRLAFAYCSKFFDTPHALIAIRVENSSIVRVSHACGQWIDLVGKDSSVEEGIIGHVLRSQTAYVSENVEEDPRSLNREYLRGLRGFMAVPLVTKEGVMGVFAVGRRERFDPEDKDIAEALGCVMATALARFRHEQALERRIAELSILHEIDLAISNTLELSFVLNEALSLALRHLGIDAGAVHLINHRTLTVECRAAQGFRTAHVWHAQPQLGKGLLGSVAVSQSPVFLTQQEKILSRCVRHRLILEEGFVAYGGFPLIVRGDTVGALELFHRAPLEFTNEWIRFAELIAGQIAVAVQNASLYTELEHLHAELLSSYEATIEGWARALEYRDRETEGHSMRVTELAIELASFMGYSGEEIVAMRRGALLHDIGKIAIPDSVLRKPGPLDDEEWALMREHPRIALEILRPIKFLEPSLDIPAYHHERWDGNGYPFGLQGPEIPHTARIFAVVDVYDALISDRPYRKAWRVRDALAHIATQAGKQFDPGVVGEFLKLMDSKGFQL